LRSTEVSFEALFDSDDVSPDSLDDEFEDSPDSLEAALEDVALWCFLCHFLCIFMPLCGGLPIMKISMTPFLISTGYFSKHSSTAG